jgi:hypothetical protein
VDKDEDENARMRNNEEDEGDDEDKDDYKDEEKDMKKIMKIKMRKRKMEEDANVTRWKSMR